MKQIILSILIACVACSGVFAQKISREEYIAKYAVLAVQEMQRVGIPASITLAQACLESGNGNSELSVASNNHFGIKCHSTWQGKRIYHDDDAKGECFRVYPRVYDSYIDHSNFLRNGQRYAFLFDFDKTDYTSWAYGLKRAGYATNPEYAKMLIKIIDDNNLHKYDLMTPEMFQKEQKNEREKEQRTIVQNNAPNSTVAPPNPWSNDVVLKKFDRAVYKNNGKKFVILQKGETIYNIARKFHIPMWKLFDFNDLEPGTEITEGTIIYLERKASRAESGYTTHKVAGGETLHSISQRYGIRVNNLAKLNNANRNDLLKEGTNIYVRKNVFNKE